MSRNSLREFIFRLILYSNTVRYLRLSQVIWRIRNVFPRRLDRSFPDAKPRDRNGHLVVPLRRKATMISEDTFRFLNEERSVAIRSGWSTEDVSLLWLYNLHYFDDLNAADHYDRTDWHKSLIENWVAVCKPANSLGWDPYPTSIRIVNWIKRDLAEPILTHASRRSLFLQARWLRQNIEYHLLANHLWMNAKALLFAGLYFQGNEASRWRACALRILQEQLNEQVLDDGGHFERSAMYHSLFVEDILDILNINNAYGLENDVEWLEAATRMLDWLAVMSHPDGEIVLFNDAAIGIAGTLDMLEQYSSRLGVVRGRVDMKVVQELSETGYIRVDLGEFSLFIDVAPIGPDYQPAHGHADTLGFELSIGKNRVLVDGGTSCYGVTEERLRQRGTAAHNTITIDGLDSSEVWSGFRVARRARVRELNVVEKDSCITITAKHDGYARLPGKPIHKRTWVVTPNSITILDEIQGSGTRDIKQFLHFHPDIELVREDRSGVQARMPGNAEGYIRIEFDGIDSWQRKMGAYHPEFGVSKKAIELVGEIYGELPKRLRTNIFWVSGGGIQ